MHIGQKKIGQVEYHPKDCLSYFRLGDLFYDWEFCILCSSSLKGETCKGVTTHTECKENSGELFKGKFDFFFLWGRSFKLAKPTYKGQKSPHYYCYILYDRLLCIKIQIDMLVTLWKLSNIQLKILDRYIDWFDNVIHAVKCNHKIRGQNRIQGGKKMWDLEGKYLKTLS